MTNWLMRKIKGGVRRVRILAGIEKFQDTEDRRVLEQVIFPQFLADPSIRRVLFVGCDWYTKVYEEIFAGREYWTIELDPGRAKFGSSQKHIIDSIENLDRHAPEGHFDLILCNGVFGWGLNERPAVERAFEQCHQRLREGGILLVGWNDIPQRRPMLLSDCDALGQFERMEFEPLGTSDYLVAGDHRHTYSFYRKTETATVSAIRPPRGIIASMFSSIMVMMGEIAPTCEAAATVVTV
jgi:SAM-dependent methyltransferase